MFTSGARLVQRTALFKNPLVAERIKDLDLLSFLDVNAAVSPRLATSDRTVGRTKFDVQEEVADRSSG